jgi:hypothetical protein
MAKPFPEYVRNEDIKIEKWKDPSTTDMWFMVGGTANGFLFSSLFNMEWISAVIFFIIVSGISYHLHARHGYKLFPWQK